MNEAIDTLRQIAAALEREGPLLKELMEAADEMVKHRRDEGFEAAYDRLELAVLAIRHAAENH